MKCVLMCYILYHATTPISSDLQIIKQWKQLEFGFPNNAVRQIDINLGNFIRGASVPVDVDYYASSDNNISKLFITIPRYRDGIPATLGLVDWNNTYQGNPLVQPYPNWTWHREPRQCNFHHIVSVFNVQIDHCGRLWVLDSGRIKDETVCPPQILAFDMKNDSLIHRNEIPWIYLDSNSLLTNIVVDSGNCSIDDTFIYISDSQNHLLIVNNVKNSSFWTVKHDSFVPDLDASNQSVDGDENPYLGARIWGMSLYPNIYIKKNEPSYLFYHSSPGIAEKWVDTQVLRKLKLFINNPNPLPKLFHAFNNTRFNQSTAEAFNKDGILLFGSRGETSIKCYNTIEKEFHNKKIHTVVEDSMSLQFVSGLKIVKGYNGKEEILVLSKSGRRNASEASFTIQRADLASMLNKTKCVRN